MPVDQNEFSVRGGCMKCTNITGVFGGTRVRSQSYWLRYGLLTVLTLLSWHVQQTWAQTQPSRPADSMPIVIPGLAAARESSSSAKPTSQPFDFDLDGDVDQADYDRLVSCLTGPLAPPIPTCLEADIDRNGVVNAIDFFWFQRCLSGTGVPARSNCARGATRIPTRPSSAQKGVPFMIGLKDLDKVERDKKVLEQVLLGNIPDFLRRFVPVTVSRQCDGVTHTATYEVMPDVLALGSDAEYCRIPMMPATAQKIADAFGCSLPTRKMSDDIYAASYVKLAPIALSPAKYRIDWSMIFFLHNRSIEAARVEANVPVGEFLGGIKKDVVISNALLDAPSKVAIYGWHRLDGKPIQPLYVGHVNTWVDYSHGIRLVKQLMWVDGRPMLIDEVLADPVLCQLLSDEGPMPDPRYH